MLADASDVAVSLHRGDLGKGWVEVKLAAGAKSHHYVIDLMHYVGKLLPKSSALANRYTNVTNKLPAAAGTGPKPNFTTIDVRPTQCVVNLARQQLLEAMHPPRCDRLRPQEGTVEVVPQHEKFRFFMNLQQEAIEASRGKFQSALRCLKKIQECSRQLLMRKATQYKESEKEKAAPAVFIPSEPTKPEVKEVTPAPSKERQASARKQKP